MFAKERQDKIYEIVSRREDPEFFGGKEKVDAVKILPYLKKEGKIFARSQ